MKSHFFAYIARMRYITRWALMRNTFSENVQEHSHMVAVLAHALAVIRNRVYGGQIDAGQVAAAALYHDASEIITGDMPTPIKYYAPEIRDAYKKVEAVACGRLLAMLPDELRPDYDDVLDCADGDSNWSRRRTSYPPHQDQGGQRGVSPRRRADPRRARRDASARAGLLYGALRGELFHDARRAGITGRKKP